VNERGFLGKKNLQKRRDKLSKKTKQLPFKGGGGERRESALERPGEEGGRDVNVGKTWGGEEACFKDPKIVVQDTKKKRLTGGFLKKRGG